MVPQNAFEVVRFSFWWNFPMKKRPLSVPQKVGRSCGRYFGDTG